MMLPNDGKIGLIDPLTLRGRQLVELLPRFPQLNGRLAAFNTLDEADHQVADIGGEPMLIPPLEAGDALDSCGAFLVASDRWSTRLKTFMRHLQDHPDAILVDLSHLQELEEIAIPVVEPFPDPSHRRVRVAHPALAAAVYALQSLSSLRPTRLDVMAIDPVSALGTHAIERLAAQAGARLQGKRPEHDIAGEALAFSTVAVSAPGMGEDARALLPGIEVTVSRLLSGLFHGHTAHLAMTFEAPIDEEEIIERWNHSPRITHGGMPLRLDAAVDQETVLMTDLEVAADRRSIAVTAFADGLLIGGALTALEVLLPLI